MSSDVKIPLTAAQIDARMLVKHMRQAPDDWERNEALAARAIQLAEQRGRKAGMEEAAKVAAEGIKMHGVDAWAKGYRCASADIEATVSAAIRSLGEKI